MFSDCIQFEGKCVGMGAERRGGEGRVTAIQSEAMFIFFMPAAIRIRIYQLERITASFCSRPMGEIVLSLVAARVPARVCRVLRGGGKRLRGAQLLSTIIYGIKMQSLLVRNILHVFGTFLFKHDTEQNLVNI